MGDAIERTQINLTQVVGMKLNPGTIVAYADKANGWTVEVMETTRTAGTIYAGTLCVGITRTTAKNIRQFNDRRYRPAITWDQLQQIKDMLWPQRIAIEFFPPKKEIVNVAPMRWLWVLPTGFGFPFSISSNYPCIGDSALKASKE